MKRYFTDSESEDDSIRHSSSNDTQSIARKKRRGVIEKRRRDRINNSLSELRRLVPTASEKQGCAKLEKAEILHLTVEHLKALQGSLYLSSTGLEMRREGFRECAAEVARYLISIEGMEPHAPLPARLLTHLDNTLSRQEREDTKTTYQAYPFICTKPFFTPLTLTNIRDSKIMNSVISNGSLSAMPKELGLVPPIQNRLPFDAFVASLPYFAPANYSPFRDQRNCLLPTRTGSSLHRNST